MKGSTMNVRSFDMKINDYQLRLADLTSDPILKQFFQRGEGFDPLASVTLPAPLPVAPAGVARMLEDA
jgi:hypothetical protein